MGCWELSGCTVSSEIEVARCRVRPARAVGARGERGREEDSIAGVRLGYPALDRIEQWRAPADSLGCSPGCMKTTTRDKGEKQVGLARPRAPQRQVMIGGGILFAAVALYQAACLLLPEESLAVFAVSDLGFCVLELAALTLCLRAAQRTQERRDRLTWLLVGLWLALNLLADATWAYYDLVLGVEPPSLGVADMGYLSSYLPALTAVLVIAWKTAGRRRMVETSLDSAMFTIVAAGLSWPLLFAPFLDMETKSAPDWVSLVYPVADLVIVFAFASFLLGYLGSGTRARRCYVVLCTAFALQIAADTGWMMNTLRNAPYVPGNWMDLVWLLAFATAGTAALMEIPAQETRETPPKEMSRTVSTRTTTAPKSRMALGGIPTWSAILIPYVGLPILAAMLLFQLEIADWQWTAGTEVLAHLVAFFVALVLIRQHVTLIQSHRLTIDLNYASSALEKEIAHLESLNQRLNQLSRDSHHLNSLRDLDEVARASVELACGLEQSPGGWLTLVDDEGKETITATYGLVDESCLTGYGDGVSRCTQGTVTTTPLELRGERLGAMYLVDPSENMQRSELLGIVAAHVATAIDNVRGYEEALRLAEKDALTGLFNRRGMRKRLVGEMLRARQNGTELSVIVIDLDDFKLLNDTLGHPTGDAVLKHTAQAIKSVLRHSDLAGRMGGDELMVALPDTGTEGAVQVSQRLRRCLTQNPYVTPSEELLVPRLSQGIATFPIHASSIDELIEAADANLYAAKQAGGDTLVAAGESDTEENRVPDEAKVACRLLDLMGAHDHYTRRHSEMVASYALLLGEALDLSDDSLDTLCVAAMLHDIGKLRVPADLLRSPGALSPPELSLVRKHVDMGVAMIKDIPRLAAAARAVEAHHEHYEGGGYPAGIHGDGIPLLGRILAVADAYSAMTLDRPYRKGLDREQARSELAKAAGTQLDPRLVQRFLELLDSQDLRRTSALAG